MSSSPFLRLNWTDIYKGLRGSLIVFVGAFLIGGWESLLAVLQTGDLGPVEFGRPLLTAGASFVLEELRRFFREYAQ